MHRYMHSSILFLLLVMRRAVVTMNLNALLQGVRKVFVVTLTKRTQNRRATFTSMLSFAGVLRQSNLQRRPGILGQPGKLFLNLRMVQLQQLSK